MPQPSLIAREVALVRTLTELSAKRAETENQVSTGHTTRTQTAQREYQDATSGTARRAELDRTATEAEYRQVVRQANAVADNELASTRDSFEKARKRAARLAQAASETAKTTREESKWEALAIFESAGDAAKKQLEDHQSEFSAEAGVFDEVAPLALAWLKRQRADAPVDERDLGDDTPLAGFKARVEATEKLLEKASKLGLLKVLQWSNYFALIVLVGGLSAGAGSAAMGSLLGAGIGLGVGLFLMFGLRWPLVTLAQKQARPLVEPLARTSTEGAVLRDQARDWIALTHRDAKLAASDRRDEAAKRADDLYASTAAEIQRRRDEELQQADQTYKPQLDAIDERRQSTIHQAEITYPARLAELERVHDQDQAQLAEEYSRAQTDLNERHLREDKALQEQWQAGIDQVAKELNAIRAANDSLFFDWNAQSPEAWVPPTESPDVLRLGEFRVDVARIADGVPRDERLKAMTPASLTLPALVSFPQRGSLLYKAYDEGRDKALESIRAVMLHYLTALPAGKVRFTILDPVGLGKNFAAFMHLADFDEQLVNSRIWTEGRHIEQRLTDLTEHMENVIQKYLRDEYETIADYNAQAGEVAEPYRVLVVANFPSNFSEQAIKRLISIASGGVRCGVQTLVAVDMRLPLPQGINLKELEQHATVLAWSDGRFRPLGSPFEQEPHILDAPPPPEIATKLIQIAGQKAKDAKRVEVPFEYIAPAFEKWWTNDSRRGIDIPLGRAGATRLQHLKLGKGTSQHVLIAGRTGSGKSTLLHALITNAALHYGPDEVELYLIDFKKGVEFKTYATHALPHARVVAIESEREFGLSVLQRLDEELKRRGDLFRDAGAQDVGSYRDSHPEAIVPRILLVVDEFQEFFIEDDKLSQEVTLLLDRLVRQGRAFGIHVHLGSQTLGGAYSLARTTLGQMGIRIALQCSESDAHLILSEENSAARLLSRPGEAIYNDANGLVEGNHPFQVVWLSDERREDYLKRLYALSAQRDGRPRPMIVFEGNTPAEITKNIRLSAALDATTWPSEAPRSYSAWLGEAIAIKDPTAAVFRRQGGANLLILGQREEAANAILSLAIVGLAAQHAPDQAKFIVLDGTPADSPLAGTIERVATVIPHRLQLVGGRQASEAIATIAADVQRRRDSESAGLVATGPTTFLLIQDLTRFRELRKSDDDFGYRGYGEEKAASPATNLATILREGPAVGIHTLLWCDTLSNLNRTMERTNLREFESRILFQMSGADSTSLIDSAVASKLGPNRAFLHEEEQGRIEKFRPYASPSDEWLNSVREQLAQRPVVEIPPEEAATPKPTDVVDDTAFTVHNSESL